MDLIKEIQSVYDDDWQDTLIKRSLRERRATDRREHLDVNS